MNNNKITNNRNNMFRKLYTSIFVLSLLQGCKSEFTDINMKYNTIKESSKKKKTEDITTQEFYERRFVSYKETVYKNTIKIIKDIKEPSNQNKVHILVDKLWENNQNDSINDILEILQKTTDESRFNMLYNYFFGKEDYSTWNTYKERAYIIYRNYEHKELPALISLIEIFKKSETYKWMQSLDHTIRNAYKLKLISRIAEKMNKENNNIESIINSIEPLMRYENEERSNTIAIILDSYCASRKYSLWVKGLIDKNLSNDRFDKICELFNKIYEGRLNMELKPSFIDFLRNAKDKDFDDFYYNTQLWIQNIYDERSVDEIFQLCINNNLVPTKKEIAMRMVIYLFNKKHENNNYQLLNSFLRRVKPILNPEIDMNIFSSFIDNEIEETFKIQTEKNLKIAHFADEKTIFFIKKLVLQNELVSINERIDFESYIVYPNNEDHHKRAIFFRNEYLRHIDKIEVRKMIQLHFLLEINPDFDDDLLQDSIEMNDYEE